jgi:KDO2-lipid IV(A) lauroyltransferase
MPPSFPASLLRGLAWLLGLPGRELRRGIARRFAARELRRDSKRARIVATNLALIGADPGLKEAVLRHTALTALESLRLWTRPAATNLREVVEVEGEAALRAAEAGGRGLLLVAPHHGNWELLVQWMAARGPFSLLYTRGGSPAVDAFLRRARERGGVTAVAADAHGMKPLLRALQRGEAVGITPDQVPEGPGGLWSPFFGQPALTMTLIHRLAGRSGAPLVLAAAERRDDGRFRIRLRPLPPEVTSGTLQAGVDALNLAVEDFVRPALAQYQWTYKRFMARRPGEDPVNPYWPHCY